jgi:catechol-2,3-dioxygenase
MPQSFEDAALTCPQESPMIEINGIAHIQLTVDDLQRAMPFYEDVLGFMGMKAHRAALLSARHVCFGLKVVVPRR